MVYEYSQEVNERFEKVFQDYHVDFQKALDGYWDIIKDFEHEEGVLSKAYYFYYCYSHYLIS